MKWVSHFATDKCESNDDRNEKENGRTKILKVKPVVKSKVVRKGRFQSIIGTTENEAIGISDEKRKIQDKFEDKRDIEESNDEQVAEQDENICIMNNSVEDKRDIKESYDEQVAEQDENKCIMNNSVEVQVKQSQVKRDDEKRNVATDSCEVDVPDQDQQNEGGDKNRNLIKDTGHGRCSLNNASFVSFRLSNIVNTSLIRLSISQLMQFTWLFSAFSTINGLPVNPNGTEPSYNIEINNPVLNFNPVPIIVNELVRLTCHNFNQIDETLPFIWSKIRSNGEKEIIAINNNPSNRTKDKYKFSLSNDKNIMELDIVRFGMTDFCVYICEIEHRKGSLNLTSKSEFLKYLSFPQQVQPILDVKGLTVEVILDLKNVYPLPIVTLIIEGQAMRLHIKTIIRIGIFYAVRLYGSTTISVCPQNEKTNYVVTIELIGAVRKYTGTTNTICSEHGGKRNGGMYLMFSPMVILLCVLGTSAWTRS